MREDLPVSVNTYNFISSANEEEKRQITEKVNSTFEDVIKRVIEALVEKEGRKDDQKAVEKLMQIYGKEIRLLSFRILDELLMKE